MNNVCHGMAKAKGCSHARLGNFGRLFPLNAKNKALGVTETEASALGGAGSPMHDQSFSSDDSNLPAGYTFFSQFVDHDITLDTTTDLHGDPIKDVCDLPNMRSPSLDMDCLYGFGPDASPHLYAGPLNGMLAVGNYYNPNDLARSDDGTALIGDPRNDENIFVSQLQLMFIRFHNKVLHSLLNNTSSGERFEAAQKIVRHHYQYLVLYDFLKRICDPKVYKFAVNQIGKPTYPKFYKRKDDGSLPMPVEFSVAAYRFGHSLVRSVYAANINRQDIELFDERFGTLGFSAVPPEMTVDWKYLLDVDPDHQPLMSKAFDHLLANELITMPDPIVGSGASNDERSLAFRNLLRGNVLALPSGQSVATILAKAGYPVNPQVDLKFSRINGWSEMDNRIQSKFEKATPLFFYIMRESGVHGGNRLGPVGSAILLEVFIGILKGCKTSFLSEKNWKPSKKIAHGKTFTLADIVRYVEH